MHLCILSFSNTHTHTHTGPDEGNSVDLAIRTPEKLSSLPKNATALRGRRGAVNRKQAETKEIKGHQFIKKFFRRRSNPLLPVQTLLPSSGPVCVCTCERVSS